MTAPKTRVLIAEDNRIMSDVLRFNLERNGFDVVAALNGRLALERLEQQEFDILLSDYQMPELDGEQLCRAARRTPLNSAIPIIMISAKGYELNVARLKQELGLSAVLYKPFSPRQVAETITSVLALGQGNPSSPETPATRFLRTDEMTFPEQPNLTLREFKSVRVHL